MKLISCWEKTIGKFIKKLMELKVTIMLKPNNNIKKIICWKMKAIKLNTIKIKKPYKMFRH